MERHQFATLPIMEADGSPGMLGFEESAAIFDHLKSLGLIDAGGRVQDSLRTALKDGTFVLPVAFSAHLAAVRDLLKKVAGNRHQGRVFLASYGDLRGEMLVWGDGPRLDASERRTSTEERDRYKVTIDQYRAMQVSLAHLVNTTCLFPDPQALVQEVRDKGAFRLMPLLKDRVFLHFQKTALVTEPIRDGERKLRRKVKKVGIDPHFAFANMLCDVAWAREVRAATIILPSGNAVEPLDRGEALEARLPGVPQYVVDMYNDPSDGEFCGLCSAYQDGAQGHSPVFGFCQERKLLVKAGDRGCPLFVSR